MTLADLSQVLAVQAACYPPDLREGPVAFESRMAASPTTNLVAEGAGGVAAYLLSHPWRSGSPPPFDAALPPVDGPLDCWFIQDLAVSPDHRGATLAARLFEAGAAAAAKLSLSGSELVAVGGADRFWRRLGYRPVASEGRPLQGYGATAIPMARDLRSPK